MKTSLRKALVNSISALAIPVTLVAAPIGAQAAEAAAAADSENPGELVVTATRRATTVQDTPVNIAAVGGEQIKQQGMTDLAQVTRFVPGIFIVDQGPRSGNTIVVRGLNATGLGSNDGNNDGGGTVATYVGDIPLFVDLKLNDIDRVELLLGPQGTLYGAGTLGGAIRFIPTRPKFGTWEATFRGETYSYARASNPSGSLGVTVNAPIGDTLAVRASLDYSNDSGFLDQPYRVKTVGVSNPDPNLSDPAAVKANLNYTNDVNTDVVLSGRFGVRWRPTDKFDVNLTYYYQNDKVGGRQESGVGVSDFPVPVNKWTQLQRVAEPNHRINQLVALEANLDLGFAELTSATGYSEYTDYGHRDQTDLLIALEYSYEAFPSFSAFTEERDKTDTLTQEIRIVSKGDSKFSWIVGGFYNHQFSTGYSKEFTPHYDQFLVDNAGGVQLRPDSVEYYSISKSKLTELAGFGELTYKITPKWQITGGIRYYNYSYGTASGTDIPLFNTVIEGRTPADALVVDLQPGGQGADGFLFKGNTSYKVAPDAMVYFTFSEGYRIGSSNGVAPCPPPPFPGQTVCALPNEVEYKPDKTLNYEFGLHSQWFDKRLTINGDIYYIQWKSPQVGSATKFGLQPITVNGGDAESKGIEINFDGQITKGLSLRGSYSHNETNFVAETINLIPYITPSIIPPKFQKTLKYDSGEPGDRLPGSPEDEGSLFARYERHVWNDKTLAFGYSFTAAGNVLTRTAGKGGGYTVPAYTLHGLSMELSGDKWKATLFVDNLFDAFIVTGARNTPAYNQSVPDINGGLHYQRGFFVSVLPPRKVGLRFEHQF